MEKKLVSYCGTCNKEIFEGDSYYTDSRFPGQYCGVQCSNEATKVNDYSFDDYQTWKP